MKILILIPVVFILLAAFLLFNKRKEKISKIDMIFNQIESMDVDLNVKYDVDFFFNGDDAALVDLSSEIENLYPYLKGFCVEGENILHYSASMNFDREEFKLMSQNFDVLAEKHNAEYDGFGVELDK